MRAKKNMIKPQIGSFSTKRTKVVVLKVFDFLVFYALIAFYALVAVRGVFFD